MYCHSELCEEKFKNQKRIEMSKQLENHAKACHCKECKRLRFVDLAEHRTQRIIHGINSIGHLSNTSHYEYNDEDFHKISRAIRKALKEAETLFLSKGNNKSTKEFHL
tara:strand:+ start:454 stop:777 length:324 start_codon:yes stop_codon:yes gene_type:complete